MMAKALSAWFRQARATVLSGIVLVVVIAWLYLLMGAGLQMETMDMGSGQTMLMAPAWTPAHAATVLLMWAVMMVAMMLPSAAPRVLLAANLARHRPDPESGVRVAALFATGYLAVWTGFSLVATLLQWGLDQAGLLSEAMASRSAVIAGGLLLAAGVYQVTPLKQAFLRDCRAPLHAEAWTSARAPFATGMRYGLRCLGCCWALMGLLFVVGLMHVLWVAGVALLVLVERTLPQGSRISRFAGATLIAWGVFTFATTAF